MDTKFEHVDCSDVRTRSENSSLSELVEDKSNPQLLGRNPTLDYATKNYRILCIGKVETPADGFDLRALIELEKKLRPAALRIANCIVGDHIQQVQRCMQMAE